MLESFFRRVLSIVSALGLLHASAWAAGPFTKGPYVQMPQPGHVTLLWESPSNYSAVVHYGMEDRLNQTTAAVTSREMKSLANTSGGTAKAVTRTFYLYKARLAGLTPGRTYSYSVGLNGTQSEPRQFRMLDPKAEEARFVVYGDSRSDPVVHRALTSQFLSHQPEFMLHSGDLVARGEDYDLWSREFFDPAAEVISRVPIFPVIGNHEHDGTNYLAYFDLPGTELWYSFDDGPVHVLALDFRRENGGDEQYRFARQDLQKSRASWKMVILHTPLYNLGGHASHWGRADYLPLFDKTKVDLVLAGHSHLYERFRPLTPRSKRPSWAITHITTGGGGANLHPGFDHPALVISDTTNHFMVFHATSDRLNAETFRADGALLDRFELRKDGGRYEHDFLAGYYPEELLDLFYEFAPALAPRFASVPDDTKSTKALLAITPRQKGRQAAELTITLAAASTNKYELVNGPLRVTTPERGHSNFVWAEVRALPGQTVSTNRSGELVPAVQFQAWVKTAKGETLAVGSSGKLSKVAQDAAKRNL